MKLRLAGHDRRRRVFLTANQDDHSDRTDACRVVTAELMAGRWRSDGLNDQGNGFLSMQKGGDETERLALARTFPVARYPVEEAGRLALRRSFCMWS